MICPFKVLSLESWTIHGRTQSSERRRFLTQAHMHSKLGTVSAVTPECEVLLQATAKSTSSTVCDD